EYKFLMREIGEAKLRLNVARLRTMQEEWQRHQGIQNERKEKLKGLEERLSGRLAVAGELEQGEGGWRTEEAALRDHLYRLVSFEEQLKALLELWDEKQRLAEVRLPAAVGPDELPRLRKRNSELEDSKAGLMDRSRKLYAQEAELVERYQELNAELNESIHEILGLEARLELLATPAGRLDSLVADRVRLRRERLAELEEERERLVPERDALSIADVAARVEEIRDELDYWVEAGVSDGEVGLDKGEMKARLSKLRGLEEKVTAKLRKTENTLGEVRDDIKSVEAELAALNREMELGRQRESELTRILDTREAERPVIEGGIRLGTEEIHHARELHRNLIEQAQRRRKLILARLDEGATRVEGAADRLRSLRDEISGIQRERDELREQMHGDDLAHAELKVKVEQLVEKIVDEHKVPLEFALKQCQEGEPESELERKVEELTGHLEHIGPVNPEAVTEKDSLEERYDFLREQVADIEQAKSELRKVVRQIDREIEGKFAQTLDDVNRNFQELFSFLFPKGRAEVRLTDPDDLLSSGVEILAQPEGKRLRRISLLSGGETALTAIAFFFALFRVRPSPFYFLDEVEAALDDVNLHRFLDLVREFKDESQLILITHQKRSMEIADVLYGITMQDDGISKVVSQRIAS
ncbi:MAG: AAA family ATPase, partial [Actinobacteria bacterium]|nr:AAA family ATPase [Actinomycetota bacterium]